MKKISVIIPIYNVEKYLDKCIKSVIEQKDCKLEVILINDGSTDDSEAIAKKYESEYSFVKCITKPNGGLSSARNEGLKYVTGDYICFIDSDDYIMEDLFKQCSKYMDENYDMIKYKTIKVDGDGNEIERIGGPIFIEENGEEAFDLMYASDSMLQPAWLYLYRAEFWKKYNFEYPVGKTHEDFARTMLIMLRAESVCSLDVYGYCYVQTDSSITRGNDEDKKFKRSMDIIEHYDYIMNASKEYDLIDFTRENLGIYCANNLILEAGNLSGENQKKYVEELKKRQVYKKIKIRDLKQLIKRMLLGININLYLKIR